MRVVPTSIPFEHRHLRFRVIRSAILTRQWTQSLALTRRAEGIRPLAEHAGIRTPSAVDSPGLSAAAGRCNVFDKLGNCVTTAFGNCILQANKGGRLILKIASRAS
jgi:hypothetical protein